MASLKQIQEHNLHILKKRLAHLKPTKTDERVERLQRRIQDEIEVRDSIQKELDRNLAMIPLLRAKLIETHQELLEKPTHSLNGRYGRIAERLVYRVQDAKYNQQDVEACNRDIKKWSEKIYDLTHAS